MYNCYFADHWRGENTIRNVYDDFYRNFANNTKLKNSFLFAAPYGIFARSCIAMAKDAKSTYQIIDDEG